VLTINVAFQSERRLQVSKFCVHISTSACTHGCGSVKCPLKLYIRVKALFLVLSFDLKHTTLKGIELGMKIRGNKKATTYLHNKNVFTKKPTRKNISRKRFFTCTLFFNVSQTFLLHIDSFMSVLCTRERAAMLKLNFHMYEVVCVCLFVKARVRFRGILSEFEIA